MTNSKFKERLNNWSRANTQHCEKINENAEVKSYKATPEFIEMMESALHKNDCHKLVY